MNSGKVLPYSLRHNLSSSATMKSIIEGTDVKLASSILTGQVTLEEPKKSTQPVRVSTTKLNEQPLNKSLKSSIHNVQRELTHYEKYFSGLDVLIMK